MSTLDSRYGRVRAGRVPGWVPVAVLTALVGLAWLSWAAWHASRQPVSSELTAFQIVSTSRLDVRLEITRREGDAVRCEVYAQAYDHSIVGEVSVDLPAGEPGTEVVTTSITTEREGFTAAVRECEVVEE